MAAKSVTAIGTINVATTTVLQLPEGSIDRASMVTIQITGSWTVGGTITFQGTVNGGSSPTWVNVLATQSTTTTAAVTGTTAGIYRVDATGLSALQLVPDGGGTGTLSVYVRPTIG